MLLLLELPPLFQPGTLLISKMRWRNFAWRIIANAKWYEKCESRTRNLGPRLSSRDRAWRDAGNAGCNKRGGFPPHPPPADAGYPVRTNARIMQECGSGTQRRHSLDPRRHVSNSIPLRSFLTLEPRACDPCEPSLSPLHSICSAILPSPP